MGWLSKIAKGVKNTFLGGAEKEAGKTAAAGNAEAAGYYKKLVPSAQKEFAPYRTEGRNAFSQYVNAVNQPDTALPTFSYGGEQPEFSYGGQAPEFSYDGAVPTTQLPTYTNQVGNFQFDPSQLETSPAYQFRLNQGLQAVNRAAGKSGNLTSGNRLLELNNYAQGLASEEYGNEFARQMEASRENYGRGVTDYDLNYQRAGDQYGIDRGAEQETYGRALTGYDIGRQNEATAYGRATDQYGFDTAREQTARDRAVEDYGIGYQRNTDEYGRNQNFLTRLSELAQMGFDVSQLLTNLDLAATTGRANARIGQGNALAAGQLGQYNSIRNTINQGTALAAAGASGGASGIAKLFGG